VPPEVQRASLASMDPYPVPAGAQLVFRYGEVMTDGFLRGDVCLIWHHGSTPHVVAANVPATGSSSQARVLGDFGKLFPEPIPVLRTAKDE